MMPGEPKVLTAMVAAGAPHWFAGAIARFRRDRFVGQLSAYATVSIVALALDVSLFLSLEASGVNASISAAAGYLAGLVLHYILSVTFVFDAKRTGKRHGRLFAEFAFSGLAGLITTVAIVSIAVDGFGAPPSGAKLLAVGMSFAITFALRRYLVFAWVAEPSA